MVKVLPYARQVLELEKIAKLEGREPPPSDEPPRRLAAKVPGAVCVVCQRPALGTCEHCTSVSYCTHEHQRVDAAWHDAVCDRLREIHQDAVLHQRIPRGELVNRILVRRSAHPADGPVCAWDEYFSRLSAGDPAERRLLSDLASRPLTLSRVLSSVGSPPLAEAGSALRVHVMAASAKDLEAPALYAELLTALPTSRIELSFVGPDLPIQPLEGVRGIRFSLRARAYRKALWSELGHPHLIVAFNAGLLIYASWKETLLELSGCRVPLIITSYRSWEARAEAELLTSLGAIAVKSPAHNPFSSLAWRRSSTIVNDLSQDNAYESVWRL